MPEVGNPLFRLKPALMVVVAVAGKQHKARPGRTHEAAQIEGFVDRPWAGLGGGHYRFLK